MEKQIDWKAEKARAQDMTLAQLHYATQDALATLPHADALDRQDGGTRGGFYRDQISIYRQEMKKR